MRTPRRRAAKRDVDRLVEALIDGERLPEGRLDDPADHDALRAAIELRAGPPGADLPDEDFVITLLRRLADERAGPAAPSASVLPRRALLAGAGAAAAGLVGAVADRALSSSSPKPSPLAQGEVVPNDGVWVSVASTADLVDGAVRPFATLAVVGFVTRRDGRLLAVSGTCTHQGCLLKLNEAASRLDCPCHRTSFALDGKLLFYQLAAPPAPLPQVQVRTRDGRVEAFVPRV